MTLDNSLYSRRSVRRFTPQPVARESVQALLERAILAPSASNLQSWRFVVVDDPPLLQRVRSFSPGIGGQPPCIVLFCLDARLLPLNAAGVLNPSHAVLDLAMAAENFMLAAVERELGTCVVRSYHPQIVKKILGLPEYVLPEFLVTLGHPDQNPDMPRRRPLEAVVTYNKGWGEDADGADI